MVGYKVRKSKSPKKSGAAATHDREELLSKLSAPTRQLAERVTAALAEGDAQALENRVTVGRHVVALRDDMTRNGVALYGHRLIDSLCQTLGWDRGLVYDTMAVARGLTDQQIAGLRDRTMANGRKVTFGHLRELVKLRAGKRREEMISKALDRSWTRAELRDAISGRTGRRGQDGRGRPMKPPRNLAELIRQQGRTADEFLRRHDKVWVTERHSLKGMVEALHPKEVREEQGKKLREHASMLRRLAEKACQQADEAERAAESVLSKLAAQGPGPDAGEAEAAGDPSR